MIPRTILITGSSGFVGSRYVAVSGKYHDIRSVTARHGQPVTEGAFSGVETVIHFGGLAHQMTTLDPGEYMRANFETTAELAETAKRSGARHFIFISTIKVYGEEYAGILTENSACNPVNDPYGESKLAAEKYLQAMASERFIVSIVRPVLIYGPGAKGNLLKLMQLCNTNYILPFRNSANPRSMVYLDNVIALVNRIVEKQIPGIFIASDLVPRTTEDLILAIRKELHRKPGIIAVPVWCRKILALVKPALAKRLFGSLIVDPSAGYAKLGFDPPYSFDTGIHEMVQAFADRT